MSEFFKKHKKAFNTICFISAMLVILFGGMAIIASIWTEDKGILNFFGTLCLMSLISCIITGLTSAVYSD